ncbi:DUF3502 domain-containing protein [Paenibacillus cymbidii]|uniref:DUF3502 domain-containing protein n=1 Tax=Paenibacillus cymbidii TaxID=1639034 RepID=UPI00107FE6B4|nr:DUF3502 domain-containing protein [Paenibacillus cymbidii]
MEQVKQIAWGKTAKWIAVAAVTTTIVSGCSGKDSGEGAKASPSASASSSSPAAGSASPVAGPYAKHLDISWIGHNQIGKTNFNNDNKIKKLIEEKFNVTLTMVPLDVHNKEQVNLFFADGKTADHIRLNVDSTFVMEQGLVREVPEDKLRKLMPSWMKSIESMVDPKIVSSTMKYKGKLYAVPFINYAALQPWVMGIRKDWLDNVGITKLPETMDEFHEVLKRFTFNDPDQNGKKDTFGSHGLQLYLRGAYGLGGSAVGVQYYADSAGKVNASVLGDNYKDYLKTLQSWYKEGLIDPESITDLRPQQRAKWADGKFGVLADHPWWYASTTATNVTQMVTDKNPKAKIDFLKPFTGPTGDKGAGGAAYPSMQRGFFFGKNTSDEKMERIMAIKEYMSADDKFYIRAYFGEEGKGYTLDKDGVIQVPADYLNVDKITQEGIGQYFALRPDNWDFYKKNNVLKIDAPAYDVAMASPKKYNDINFTVAGTNDSLLKYGTAVNTVVTEFETNASSGKIDIDKEWEGFKKKFLDAGGQSIIADYQKLYDESNKK